MLNQSISLGSLGSLCYEPMLQKIYCGVKGSFALFLGTYTHFRGFWGSHCHDFMTISRFWGSVAKKMSRFDDNRLSQAISQPSPRGCLTGGLSCWHHKLSHHLSILNQTIIPREWFYILNSEGNIMDIQKAIFPE
jgi:hypothetical protein